MKSISQHRHKGLRKYKLNATHLLKYNSRTGFYKNRIEICTDDQPINTNHWKCEKCDNLFMRLRELKQHKEEHHAY